MYLTTGIIKKNDLGNYERMSSCDGRMVEVEGDGTFENPYVMTGDGVAQGDFVHCNNCDAHIIVNHGEDVCPCCKYHGGLAWADTDNEDNHEVNRID